jgi:Calcineurin-like phosphoesterase
MHRSSGIPRADLLYYAKAPGMVDTIGESTYIIDRSGHGNNIEVSGYCPTFDGTNGQYISVPHITGAETVVSKKGSATPTISAGKIDVSSGTLGYVLLSDGTELIVQSGKLSASMTVFDNAGIGDGALVGFSSPAFTSLCPSWFAKYGGTYDYIYDLVANGSFTTSASWTPRPTYSTAVFSAGEVRLTRAATGGYSRLEQTLPVGVVAGRTYYYSITFRRGTDSASTVYIGIGGANRGGYVLAKYGSGETVTRTGSFVAASSGTGLSLGLDAGAIGTYIDFLDFKLGEKNDGIIPINRYSASPLYALGCPKGFLSAKLPAGLSAQMPYGYQDSTPIQIDITDIYSSETVIRTSDALLVYTSIDSSISSKALRALGVTETRFGFIADSHYSPTLTPVCATNLIDTRNHILQEGVSGIISLGDTYRGELWPDASTMESEITSFESALQYPGEMVRKGFTIGNHDGPTLFAGSFADSIALSQYLKKNHYMIINNIRIIMWSTVSGFADYNYDAESLQFLTDQLDAAALAGNSVIVCGHVNLTDTITGAQTAVKNAILNSGANVLAIFNGHSHVYEYDASWQGSGIPRYVLAKNWLPVLSDSFFYIVTVKTSGEISVVSHQI